MLIMAESWALAGRTHRYQPMAALSDLPAYQRPKRRFVHRAVLERCDQGGERASELRLGSHGLLPNARLLGFAAIRFQFISGLAMRRKAITAAAPMALLRALGLRLRFCRLTPISAPVMQNYRGRLPLDKRYTNSRDSAAVVGQTPVSEAAHSIFYPHIQSGSANGPILTFASHPR